MNEISPNDTPTKTISTREVSPGVSPSSETNQQDETVLDGSALKPARVELGKSFGEYRLIEEIGRGGVGVVYSADQERPKRRVALKVLHGGERSTDAEVQRLHAEADAAAALDHRNIVPVYEVGEIDGWHFLAMAFVEGGTLADRLQEGPLPADESSTMLKRIAEGVAFAQKHNIVHRDLKPANILLDNTGEPRVADFGLAKRLQSDSQLTATGQIMGTPSYMAPEQATGQTDLITTATDVYALGGILYCMLTGRPPFQAATLTETMIQVVQCDPVAPSVVNPAVDRDLETICLKSLEKSPERRYGNAAELVEELERYSKGSPLRARRIGPFGRAVRWVRRNKLTATLLATIAVLLLSGTIVSTYFAMQARDRADEIERLSRELMALVIKVQDSERVLPVEKPPAIKKRMMTRGAKSKSRPMVSGPKLKGEYGTPELLSQSPTGPPSRPTQRVRATRLRGLYKSKVARLRKLAPDLAGEFSKQLQEDK